MPKFQETSKPLTQPSHQGPPDSLCIPIHPEPMSIPCSIQADLISAVAKHPAPLMARPLLLCLQPRKSSSFPSACSKCPFNTELKPQSLHKASLNFSSRCCYLHSLNSGEAKSASSIEN